MQLRILRRGHGKHDRCEHRGPVFDGAHLDGKGGPALTADGITVTGGISCDQEPAGPDPGQGERFRADGMISLRGANVSELVLSGGCLDGTPREADGTPRKGGDVGHALDADQLTVTRGMYCNNGFYAKGLISLRAASVYLLSFRDARLECVKRPDDGMSAMAPSTGPTTTTSAASTQRVEDVLRFSQRPLADHLVLELDENEY